MNAAGRPPRPRLIDIARIVGLHSSIVSRILNNDPDLSVRPATRERVLEVAASLGYRPNASARGLKTLHVGAVGVVMPSLRNPVTAQIVRGIMNSASAKETGVLVVEVPDETPDPKHDTYIRLVQEGRVAGLLLANAEPQYDLRERIPTDVPFLHVNRASRHAGVNVTMDEARAVQLALDHLCDLGHRYIAQIDGPEFIDTVQRRTAAMRSLARDRGLRVEGLYVPFDEAGGYDATRQLLGWSGEQPTAVTVGSLSQLLGVLAGFRAAGLDIPGQISVLSFDEDPYLKYLDIQVTSVDMPMFQLGEAAMDELAQRLTGGPQRDVQVSEPMTLVPRVSTAAPL